MRYLEMRRHSLRVRPSEHLSQEGVTLARRVGEGRGPFHLVLTSPALRAVETAVAMGFAITETYQPVALAGEEWLALDQLMPEGTPFARRALVMKEDPLAARYGEALRRQWMAVAQSLPEGGRALVVSHGGYLDDVAVACLPDAPHETWGPNLGQCEGIELAHDGTRFVSGDFLRLG